MFMLLVILIGTFIAIILSAIIIYGQRNDTFTASSDIENKLSQMITNDFLQIGWNDWDFKIHSNKEQLKRLERAVKSKNIMLMEYDKYSGIATIVGDSNKIYYVSNNHCTCADFKNRMLPCKHMYFLAIALSEQKEKIGDEIW